MSLELPSLIWNSQNWLQTPWVLWTAPLVHPSWAHGLANLLALVLLCALAYQDRVLKTWGIGIFVLWPLSTLSLVALPYFGITLTHYAGLSGLLHGAAVWLGYLLLCRSRWVGVTLLLGITAKLLSEQAWTPPVRWTDDWGFHVAQIAHLMGALTGLLVVLLSQFCSFVAIIVHRFNDRSV